MQINKGKSLRCVTQTLICWHTTFVSLLVCIAAAGLAAALDEKPQNVYDTMASQVLVVILAAPLVAKNKVALDERPQNVYDTMASQVMVVILAAPLVA